MLGIILGGGAGSRLYPLTKKRAKPAVPLGANYRLIDIPVSNCINSNVNKIYCLTQFNSASLNRHLSQAYNANVGGYSSRGFVEVRTHHPILTPHPLQPVLRLPCIKFCILSVHCQISNKISVGCFEQVLAASQSPIQKKWFQGTADAVRQYLWLFENSMREGVEDFLILAGLNGSMHPAPQPFTSQLIVVSSAVAYLAQSIAAPQGRVKPVKYGFVCRRPSLPHELSGFPLEAPQDRC